MSAEGFLIYFLLSGVLEFALSYWMIKRWHQDALTDLGDLAEPALFMVCMLFGFFTWPMSSVRAVCYKFSLFGCGDANEYYYEDDES